MTDSLLVTRDWKYAAHVPWQTPVSLSHLHGPLTGVVTVPSRIDTSLDPTYDLSDSEQRYWFYVGVVRDGMPSEQTQWLDHATLISLWPDLILPIECRQAWENKFPELASSTKR